MPAGIFKGTDEELKKLSEFIANLVNNNRNKKLTEYRQLFYLEYKFIKEEYICVGFILF